MEIFTLTDSEQKDTIKGTPSRLAWIFVMADNQNQEQIVRQLAERLQHWQGRNAEATVVSTGIGPLDELLPERGYRRGSLVEWIAASPGSGATTLALHTASQARQQGGDLVVVDRERQFYPPALTNLIGNWRGLIVVRPANAQEEMWALDQILRCQAVAAVFAWVDRLDGRNFPRLQLSAEAGDGLGIFFRPLQARKEPTWAQTRWLVEPKVSQQGDNRRQLTVTLLKSRTALSGQSVQLEVEIATGRVHLVPSLAFAAAHQRQAGA